MIVHDEDTLQQALTLIEQSPVRYSDAYSYIVYSGPLQLEFALRRALERDDIAIVVPVGQEQSMENHAQELVKVKVRRKRWELKNVRKWISEHPEIRGAETEQEIIRLYRKARKGGA